MAKRSSATRNIILYIVAVAVLAGLIVVVSTTRRTVRIMPPESDEMAAKRQAPENAYLTLVEAVKLLPERPKPLMVPFEKNPNAKFPYKAEPRTLGSTLNIDRPDTDAELAGYVSQCGPAVAKTREALTKPYYLYPENWDDFETLYDYPQERRQEKGSVYGLQAALAGCALQSVRTGGDGSDAFQYLLDALRLGILMRSDTMDSGGIDSRLMDLWYMPEIMQASSEATLRAVFEPLAALQRDTKPPVANLEYSWRALDHVVKLTSRPSEGPLGVLEGVMLDMALKRLRRAIAANQDSLRGLVALSFPDFKQWAKDAAQKGDKRLLEAGTTAHGIFGYLPTVESLIVNKAYTEVALSGMELTIALELYRRAHSEYPAELAALAPPYLSAVPNDPFTGKPYVYRRADGDYFLYSLGRDQKDHDGLERKGNIAIHRPPEPE